MTSPLSPCHICHRSALLDCRGRCYRCWTQAITDLELTDEEQRIASALAIAALEEFLASCRESAREAS